MENQLRSPQLSSASPEPEFRDMIMSTGRSEQKTESQGVTAAGSDDTRDKMSGSERESEPGSENDVGAAASSAQKKTRNRRPKPRKLRSASRKTLEEMHKETQRLVRNQDVSINPRVVKKLDMASFLQKFKSTQGSLASSPPNIVWRSSDASSVAWRPTDLSRSSPPSPKANKCETNKRRSLSPFEGQLLRSPSRVLDKGKGREIQSPPRSSPFREPFVESPPRPRVDKGKGKAPQVPSPVRTPAGEMCMTGHAPVVQYIVARREQLESTVGRRSTAEGSDSDLEIVGAPGAPDANAHLPEVKRILANRPSFSTGGTILPQPCRVAMSSRRKYYELAGIKSPPSTDRRKRTPSSSAQLFPWRTPTLVGGMKELNATLREKIAEQAAERRKLQEEQARAAGVWRPSRIELMDADVPREAAMPQPRDEKEEEQDEDYVSSGSGTAGSDGSIPSSDVDATGGGFGSDSSEDEGIFSGPAEDLFDGSDGTGERSGGEAGLEEEVVSGKEGEEDGEENVDENISRTVILRRDDEDGHEEDADENVFRPRAGDSVQRKPRNEFIDEEAEEEEDELVGFGGWDGDASDDDDEDLKDMIETRRMSERELKADKVRDLHRQQIAEQDQRTVEQLIKDLEDGGGGLLRKRHGLGDGLGFGLDSDSDFDDDDNRYSFRRRQGKRGRFHEINDPFGADKSTAAFAYAQKGPNDDHDDPFASEDEEAQLKAYKERQSAVLQHAEHLRNSATSVYDNMADESFSAHLFMEEENVDIETQNSEILSIINDRTNVARTRHHGNATPPRPRRRLLDASPSRLQLIRSTHNDESSASSSRGGHIGGFAKPK